MTTAEADLLWEEVGALAFYLHWPLDTLLDAGGEHHQHRLRRCGGTRVSRLISAREQADFSMRAARQPRGIAAR